MLTRFENMINERINLSIEDGIASVVLSRPDKMNALDSKMFEALAMTAELIRDDKRVRVVVISGEGKAFCAGLDMENFSSMLDPNASKEQGLGDLATRTHGIANDVQHAVWAWHELAMPVIAAVHGVAVGVVCKSPWLLICVMQRPKLASQFLK